MLANKVALNNFAKRISKEAKSEKNERKKNIIIMVSL